MWEWPQTLFFNLIYLRAIMHRNNRVLPDSQLWDMIKQAKRLILEGVKSVRSPLKTLPSFHSTLRTTALGKEKSESPTGLNVRKWQERNLVETWRDRKKGPDNNLQQGQVNSEMSVGHSCGGIQDHKVWTKRDVSVIQTLDEAAEGTQKAHNILGSDYVWTALL